MSRCTIRLSPDAVTQDSLAISVFNGLSQGSGYSQSSKTLVITGLGTAATYQAVLQTLTFHNPSSNPNMDNNGRRTIIYTLEKSDGTTLNAVEKNLDVVLLDDPPVLTFSHGGTVSYTEKSGKMVLDAGVTVTDQDSASITELEVKISSGMEAGRDLLELNQVVSTLTAADGVTNLGLTSAWTAGTGTLTVSGTASKAVYQDILRKVTFINDHYDASAATRKVQIKIKDLTSYSATAEITLNFVSVNQIAALTATTTDLTWNENTGAIVLFSDAAFTDQDHTQAVSATFTFSANYQQGKDTFTYGGAVAGITGTFDAAAGTLTLSGTATIANYQLALRDVRYSNVDENPIDGERTVQMKVNDSLNDSNVVSRKLIVVSANDFPILTGTTSSLGFEGRSVTLLPNAAITDVDHANLASATITISTGCDSVDTLVVDAPQAGVSTAYTTSPCVLTLTGSATKAAYQAALRSVRLQQTGSGTSVEKIMDFVINDGMNPSATLTRKYYASDYLVTPTVTAVTKSETAGSLVTITGTSFGPTAPMLVNKVQIGTSLCTGVTVITANTQLTCTAPAGTGKGLPVEVTVSDVKSPTKSIFSYQDPTVVSATPASTAGGTVTVTGTNFGPIGANQLSGAAGGSVTINGLLCTSPTVTVANTKLTCTIVAGTGTGKNIIVTVDTLGSGTTGNGKYAYAAPTISSVQKGSFLGYQTVLTGSNFGPVGTTGITVSFAKNGGGGNTFSCATVSVSTAHTGLQCTPPQVSEATAANTNDLTLLYDVTITVDGVAGTSASMFQYEGPVITSIPTISYYGAYATITGRNFGPVATAGSVTIGGAYTTSASANTPPVGASNPATITADTTFKVYIRDYVTVGNSMSPSIQVTINGQASNVFTGFTFEGPVITGTTTGSQFGGDTITIQGRNFGPEVGFAMRDLSGSDQIQIGGTAVTGGTQRVKTQSTITATVSTATNAAPNSGTGLNLVVTLLSQNTGTTGNGKFNYLGPEVTSVTSVTTAGGLITITGKRFGPVKATADYFNTGTYANAKVQLCANAACSAEIACNNPEVTTANTKIKCTMVEGVAINTKVVVKLFDAVLDSGTTGAGKLAVTTPTVSGVTPTVGVSSAGAEITIAGTSFGPAGNSFASVTVDGNPCTAVTVSTANTEIKCTAPAGTGASKSVLVKLTRDTQTLTSAANTLFKYSKPTITAVSAPATSGGMVTITGTNFGPTGATKITSITLNGAAVLQGSVTVAHTTIVGNFPTAGTGQGYSAIVTIDSQANDANTLFGYAAPTVTSITTRPSIFGGIMTVAGTNMGATGLAPNKISVTVTGDGNAACAAPSVNNHVSVSCTIICTTPCSDGNRDVTVTIDSQNSGTTGNGKLSYEGPVITSVADTSFHGTSIGPVTVTGRNFGKVDRSDGGVINYVKICPKDKAVNCGGLYETLTGAGTGNIPKVTVDSTAIEGYSVAHKGENYTVTLSINNVVATLDGALDFVGPQITSGADGLISNTVGTGGGQLIVNGLRFGPAGNTNIRKIVWDNSATTVTPANSGATVNTVNTEIRFTVPAGAGTKEFSLDIANDGTDANVMSTGLKKMKYQGPTVTSVTSVSSAGGVMTITGTNFGPAGTQYLTLVKLVQGGVNIPATSPTVSIAHTQITAVVPGGSGLSLDVEVTVGGQVGKGTGVFNYLAPKITSIAPISTGPTWTTVGYAPEYNEQQDAWVTIVGENFGPVATIASLTIGGQPCLNAKVTVAHTTVMCLFGPGSGKNYAVVFQVNGQALSANSGVNAFGYQAPTVTSVTKSSFFGGTTLTIVGTNFGPAVGDANQKLPAAGSPLVATAQTITVTVAGAACTSVTIATPHTTLTCAAPARLDQTTITNLAFVVSVGANSVTTTYSYDGPTITAVSEASFLGGTVTVTGTAFGPLGSANVGAVFIGGIQQDLTALNPTVTKVNTEIQFTAPQTSGGSLDLELNIRSQSTGETGRGLMTFTGPRVDSATPVSTTGGVTTITGRNFGPVGNANIEKVSIDGVACQNPTVTIANSQITCTVQPGTGKDQNILVRISGESDQGSGVDKFSFMKPQITSVSPMNSPGGSTITITGSSFGPNIVEVGVTVGGIACTNLAYVTLHEKLTCTTPADGVGIGKGLIVTVNGVVSDTGSFTYSPPEVHSVTAIDSNGGQVTITGDHFGAVGATQITSVMFGNALCEDPTVTVNDKEIKCTVPKATLVENGGKFLLADLEGDGLMDVVVTIDNNPSSTGTNKFAFVRPTVKTVKPLDASFGTTITVTGTDFGNIAAEVSVKVDTNDGAYQGLAPKIITAKGNRMIFQMPAVYGFSNLLRVFVNGREADHNPVDGEGAYPNFGRRVRYKNPVITRTVPPPSTSGGTATFVGTGFGPSSAQLALSPQIDFVKVIDGSKVINCLNARVTVEDTEIECTMPDGNGGDLNASITVKQQSSGETGNGLFKYPDPIVTSVAPQLGPPGTLMYVTGSNFGSNPEDVVIFLEGAGDETCGGVNCTLSGLSQVHTQATCVVPVNVGSNILVRANVRGLKSAANYDATYSLPSPLIGTVGPAATAGSIVTVTGVNFGPSGECYKNYFETVTIDGRDCTDPTVSVSGTEILCLSPEGAGKELDVFVQMRGAHTGTSGQRKFSYQPPNVISAVPLTTEGGEVVITGTDFGPATVEGAVAADIPTVTIKKGQAEIPCTNPRVTTAHTEIKCNLIAGTGKDFNIDIGVKEQVSGSTGLAKFRYMTPVLTGLVSAAVGKAGERITVTGNNFGTDERLIDVKVGDKLADRSSIRLFIIRGSSDMELSATIPFGAGEGLFVTAIVDGQESQENANVRFSYNAPFVTSATPASTHGGITTITGGNFGPVGPVTGKVEVAGAPCANAAVSIANTEIKCTVVPGTGVAHDIFIQVDKDQTLNTFDSGKGKFRYACPEVLGLTYDPPFMPDVGPGKSGQKITVTGRNFGSDKSLIAVTLREPTFRGTTEFMCTGLEYDESFAPGGISASGTYRVILEVPVGYGTDMAPVILVDTQDNADTCETPSPLTTSDILLFDYPVPVIEEVTPTPSQGGTLVLTGKFFGPKGTLGVDRVIARDYTNQPIPCDGALVDLDNTIIHCSLAAGVGKELQLGLEVGGQFSGLNPILSYQLPIVESVSPTVVSPGDTITVKGYNFGDASQYTLANLLKGTTTADLYATVAAEVQVTKPHTEIEFPIPMGAGAGYTVQLQLPAAPFLDARYAVTSKFGFNLVTFDYAPPVVANVSAVPTKGGVATVKGTGFGAVDINAQVYLGENLCADPAITVPDTELTCTVGAGTGGSKPVRVKVFGQEQAFPGKFAYQIPVVTKLDPAITKAGTKITIQGHNFGDQEGLISADLGGLKCLDVKLVKPHEAISCVVPQGDSFCTVNNCLEAVISVTAAGLTSDVSATGVRMTYTLQGCMDPVAENYTPYATIEDGSCIIVGCTDTGSITFNPKANKLNTLDCLYRPKKVEMKLDLEFDKYLADPQGVEDTFKREVAANIGIDPSRIKIIEVKKGSTVFIFEIIDDSSFRADAAVLTLENKLLKNSFKMSLAPVLEVKAEGSEQGKIRNTAGDPRVSTESIIGISACTAVIIFWAIFWRRLVKICATCCGFRGEPDDSDDLLEVSIMGKNQSRKFNVQGDRLMLPAPYSQKVVPRHSDMSEANF